jgi:hypothetical protein
MSDEIDTEALLYTVLRSLANRAAQGAAYSSWSDEFARKEVREVWADKPSIFRERIVQRVTVADLQAVPVESLNLLGFGNWDDDLTLIPLWAWNYIADGEELTSINGETKRKGVEEIDLDVRFGCIACGFKTAAKATGETK